MSNETADLYVVLDLSSDQRFRLQMSKLTEVKHQFWHKCFSSITSDLLGIEHRFCYHCVPLVETNYMIPNLTLKSQGQSLTEVQRSGQVKVGHVAYNSIWSDETSILVPFSFIYHIWFKSYRQNTYSPIDL